MMQLIEKLSIYDDIEKIEKDFPNLQVYWSEDRAHVYDDKDKIALTAPLTDGRPGQWEPFAFYETWEEFLNE